MKKQITVELKSCGNPDYRQYESISPMRKAYVESIEMAQEAVSHYIKQFDLGGGNWAGGKVCMDGTQIGHISYNGRFWPVGHEYCKA